MNYEQTLQYLYSSTPVFEHVGAAAYKEGLYNTKVLDEHFGHPHRNYKTVHVAGTNGKGSCSHTLAAILQSEGYRVGLYTSPHLVDFRERIRVNGECISKRCVIDFVEHERSFFESLHPSFFELTTALAFKYFAEQNVDIAVIEVGLGGRLDCTNIITPILSVITNISYDHTQFLGDTLAKIASEKAGIIKRGVPCVVGETTTETLPVFIHKAESVNAPISFAEKAPEVVSSVLDENGKITYSTRSYGLLESELCGEYQKKNTNTILCAVDELKRIGIIHDVSSVQEGFRHVSELTGLRGRWEKLSEKPLVIYDTGHNVGGWEYLSRQIAIQKCKTLRIVFGMVDDKDLETVMEMMPQNAVFYFTQATTHRAIPVDKVAEVGRKHGLHGTEYSTVRAAYLAAIEDACSDDFIFIGGSSYVVSDLLSFIGDEIPCKGVKTLMHSKDRTL